jgi:hypothetical protein
MLVLGPFAYPDIAIPGFAFADGAHQLFPRPSLHARTQSNSSFSMHFRNSHVVRRRGAELS